MNILTLIHWVRLEWSYVFLILHDYMLGVSTMGQSSWLKAWYINEKVFSNENFLLYDAKSILKRKKERKYFNKLLSLDFVWLILE
jgi:hypothetical protein